MPRPKPRERKVLNTPVKPKRIPDKMKGRISKTDLTHLQNMFHKMVQECELIDREGCPLCYDIFKTEEENKQHGCKCDTYVNCDLTSLSINDS
jgi:hypothetical protein